MTANIKHLVFDMGGVLVEIDWHGKISKLLNKEVPFEQIHALWAASTSATQFEEGKINFDTFTLAFIEEHQLEISAEQFQQDYMDIIVGDFPGVCDLLEALQKRYTVSLLSNTNPAHWDYIVEKNTILQFVDNPFTSLYFGVMKPHASIYQKLITQLNAKPSEILFFDDGKVNVEAARAQGLHAEQVFGPDDIKQVLNRYQLHY